MIRQAISCDICGAEKQQTNHWFVASVHGGELRITGWDANNRLRSGTKHLCGQTCLHKLVDDFIARSVSARVQAATVDIDDPEVDVAEPMTSTDASENSTPAYISTPAPARTVSTPPPAPRPAPAIPAAVIAIAPTRTLDEARPLLVAPVVDDTPNYGSRRRRTEAWERERERERRSAMANHRKSS